MLSKLHVINFALVEDVDLDFSNNLIVFSGETGAGKSILINAINFALGERSDKNFVRFNCPFAFTELVFENVSNDVVLLCGDYGIEYEDKLIISRKIMADGKSEARINGVMVNISTLKAITSKLVDVYGQHQHQCLLDENLHLKFIDDYKKVEELDKLKVLLKEQKEIQKKLSSLGGDEGAILRSKDILEFELKELEEANLQIGEDLLLEDRKKIFDNIKKLADAANLSFQYLSENENSFSVSNCLYNAQKSVQSVCDIDNKFVNVAQRLSSAAIEIEDIKDSLNDILYSYDFSEEEYQQVESRLEIIKNIKRKYGGSTEQALLYKENIERKIEEISNSVELINELTQKEISLKEEMEQIAEEISAKRKIIAKDIEEKIESQLKDLSMKDAVLKIEFKRKGLIDESGFDDVVFMFSANHGEPLRLLSKVISGGEMSRFMLAFKKVFADKGKISTAIFDEIDSGIGGEVGVCIASKLAQISKTTQVIVVTHLASIGCIAGQHFFISKSQNKNRTNTVVKELNDNEKIEEIARLAGGYNGESAKQFALELKARCCK